MFDTFGAILLRPLAGGNKPSQRMVEKPGKPTGSWNSRGLNNGLASLDVRRGVRGRGSGLRPSRAGHPTRRTLYFKECKATRFPSESSKCAMKPYSPILVL